MPTTPEKPIIGAVQQKEDMDLMPAIKKERGKAERMTVGEILAKSLAKTGRDPVQIQNALSQLVRTNPKFRVLRSHNTLFFYMNMGNGTVEASVETADNPRNFIAAIQDAVKAMKVAGFKSATLEINNPQILKAVQMAKINYQLIPGKGMMPDGTTPRKRLLVEF